MGSQGGLLLHWLSFNTVAASDYTLGPLAPPLEPYIYFYLFYLFCHIFIPPYPRHVNRRTPGLDELEKKLVGELTFPFNAHQ